MNVRLCWMPRSHWLSLLCACAALWWQLRLLHRQSNSDDAVPGPYNWEWFIVRVMLALHASRTCVVLLARKRQCWSLQRRAIWDT